MCASGRVGVYMCKRCERVSTKSTSLPSTLSVASETLTIHVAMSGRPCWSGTSEQLVSHDADLPLGAEVGASVALGTPVLPAVSGDKKEKRRAQNRESQKAFRRRKASQDAEVSATGTMTVTKSRLSQGWVRRISL